MGLPCLQARQSADIDELTAATIIVLHINFAVQREKLFVRIVVTDSLLDAQILAFGLQLLRPQLGNSQFFDEFPLLGKAVVQKQNFEFPAVKGGLTNDLERRSTTKHPQSVSMHVLH